MKHQDTLESLMECCGFNEADLLDNAEMMCFAVVKKKT